MKWEKGFNVELFLDRLEEGKNCKDGRVSFSGFEVMDIISVFASNLSFDSSVTFFAEDIIREALFVSGEKTLNSKNFTNSIKRIENKYIHMDTQKYYIATDISIDMKSPDLIRRVDGTKIYIKNSFPKRIKRKNFLEKNAPSYNYKSLDGYKKIYAIVDARTPSEAGSIGLRRINYYRGLWNYLCGFRTFCMTMGGSRSPFHKILLGPIHSIHDYNTGDYFDNWYYECSEYIATPYYMQNYEKLRDNEIVLKNKISKSIISDLIIDCIIDYCMAFDVTDYNHSFIILWSILERLTCTTNDPGELTVKRISNLFKCTDYHICILRHLNKFRNKFIHACYSRKDEEKLLMQLKNFVDLTIRDIVYLSNKFKYKSELLDYMDLSRDVTILKKKMQLITKKVKMFSS